MTTVLHPVPAPAGPPTGGAGDGLAGERAEPPRSGPPQLRLGAVGLGSAALYLLVWAFVLFVVTTAVLVAGYAALERFGVLTSLSRTVATVLSQPLPASGLLPALELPALLPYALLASGVLALLWLVASLAFVCVHNAVSTLTGGLRVRVR